MPQYINNLLSLPKLKVLKWAQLYPHLTVIIVQQGIFQDFHFMQTLPWLRKVIWAFSTASYWGDTGVSRMSHKFNGDTGTRMWTTHWAVWGLAAMKRLNTIVQALLDVTYCHILSHCAKTNIDVWPPAIGNKVKTLKWQSCQTLFLQMWIDQNTFFGDFICVPHESNFFPHSVSRC